jgi:hypothetical protein
MGLAGPPLNSGTDELLPLNSASVQLPICPALPALVYQFAELCQLFSYSFFAFFLLSIS